jgi:peptidoglycan/xylan/chitin deacetylase (PgdA/CDA1 family)
VPRFRSSRNLPHSNSRSVTYRPRFARSISAIASHTRTHPSLPSLSPSALGEELAGSRRYLEDLVGAPVDLFAYPFGHHDPTVREAVAAAGYRAGYSFLNGRITAGLDRYRLPRLNMWSGQGRSRLAYHLARPPASWPPTQLETVLHWGGDRFERRAEDHPEDCSARFLAALRIARRTD